MPSDDRRIALALEALARPIAEFRAALEGALTQAELALGEATASPSARVTRVRAELGLFAAGRVLPDRLAAVEAPAPLTQPAARAALARAVQVLRNVAARGDRLFLVHVPPGGSLGTVVGTALAEAGRAFGAVMLAELARGGRYVPAEHDRLLDPLAFRDWNRAERRFAPPLVVVVDGKDLHATALADYADGREKIVLVVEGPCAPAALARLITPGTLVLQTVDGTGLDRVVAFDGPSVAALLPEGAAQFLHDPARGAEPWQRLSVATPLPAAPKQPIGGMSAWQMAEDLRQLTTLAQVPVALPKGGRPALGEAEAVERLSAWLLDATGGAG